MQGDPDIKLAQEKAIETQLKQKDVQRKRLLFFFKYFNAEFLESAADSDVQAADAHVANVTLQGLLRTIETYYVWLWAALSVRKAALQEQTAWQTWQAQKNRFQAGQLMQPEVLQAQLSYHQAQSQLAEARQRSALAWLPLAHVLTAQTGKPAGGMMQPSALELDTAIKTSDELASRLVAPIDQVADPVAFARCHRPDWLELRYRKEALRRLAQGTPIASYHRTIVESSLRQLHWREVAIERGVRLALAKAQQERQQTKEGWTSANEALQTAETLVQTVAEAYTLGQVSKNVRQDSEHALLMAQWGHAQANVARQLAELRWVAALGQLNVGGEELP